MLRLQVPFFVVCLFEGGLGVVGLAVWGLRGVAAHVKHSQGLGFSD